MFESLLRWKKHLVRSQGAKGAALSRRTTSAASSRVSPCSATRVSKSIPAQSMPAGKKSEKGLNPNLAEMLRFGGGMKSMKMLEKEIHGFSREITDICRFFLTNHGFSRAIFPQHLVKSFRETPGYAILRISIDRCVEAACHQPRVWIIFFPGLGVCKMKLADSWCFETILYRVINIKQDTNRKNKIENWYIC